MPDTSTFDAPAAVLAAQMTISEPAGMIAVVVTARVVCDAARTELKPTSAPKTGATTRHPLPAAGLRAVRAPGEHPTGVRGRARRDRHHRPGLRRRERYRHGGAEHDPAGDGGEVGGQVDGVPGADFAQGVQGGPVGLSLVPDLDHVHIRQRSHRLPPLTACFVYSSQVIDTSQIWPVPTSGTITIPFVVAAGIGQPFDPDGVQITPLPTAAPSDATRRLPETNVGVTVCVSNGVAREVCSSSSS